MPATTEHINRLAERARLGLPLLSSADDPPPLTPPTPRRERRDAAPSVPHTASGWTQAQLREWDRLRKRQERLQRALDRGAAPGPPEGFWWLLMERGRPCGLFPARTRAEAYRRARVATGRNAVGRGLWPGASLRLVRPAAVVAGGGS